MIREIYSLKRDTQEFHSALLRSKVIRYGEVWAALPREVVRSASGSKEATVSESVIFEITRWADFAKPSVFRIFWKAIRIETLLWSMLPFIMICLFGMTQGGAAQLGSGYLLIVRSYFLTNCSEVLE